MRSLQDRYNSSYNDYLIENAQDTRPIGKLSSGYLIFGTYLKEDFIPFEYAKRFANLDGRKRYLIYSVTSGDYFIWANKYKEILDPHETFHLLLKHGLVTEDGYASGKRYLFDV